MSLHALNQLSDSWIWTGERSDSANSELRILTIWSDGGAARDLSQSLDNPVVYTSLCCITRCVRRIDSNVILDASLKECM